jgi:hypothetical protein
LLDEEPTMTSIGIFRLAVILFVGISSSAALADARAKSELTDGASAYSPNNGNVCVLSGPPPMDLQYQVFARIVATKRTYGSVDELYSPMIREARIIGADAIINLQASQRFKGPLPWRITSPTGDGQAIKILPGSPELDCVQAGGTLWGPDGTIGNSPIFETVADPSHAAAQDEPISDGAAIEEPGVRSESTPKADLYKELLKLDDLRQRGILTEAEFQAEKKKLLERN